MSDDPQDVKPPSGMAWISGCPSKSNGHEGWSLDEPGYYLLAGAGETARRPSCTSSAPRRGKSIGNYVHLRTLERQKAASPDRGGVRRPHPDRHRRNQSQHPPPTDHRFWATTCTGSPAAGSPGVGRGIAAIYRAFGIDPVSTAQLEDFAVMMRRLWRGEVIGSTTTARWAATRSWCSTPPSTRTSGSPWSRSAPTPYGLGGRLFDDIILHTYFTPETLTRCVQTVGQVAEDAGPDPADVRVWSCCHRRRPPARRSCA